MYMYVGKGPKTAFFPGRELSKFLNRTTIYRMEFTLLKSTVFT